VWDFCVARHLEILDKLPKLTEKGKRRANNPELQSAFDVFPSYLPRRLSQAGPVNQLCLPFTRLNCQVQTFTSIFAEEDLGKLTRPTKVTYY